MSCHGCFPECSACPARWGCAPSQHSSGAAPAGLPHGAAGLPGPALYKRRNAADAAGGLQGESQLLGTGGREESRGAAPPSRRGAPGPGRGAGHSCGGSAVPAVPGERSGASSGAPARPGVAAVNAKCFCGCIEFSFPKMFLHN